MRFGEVPLHRAVLQAAFRFQHDGALVMAAAVSFYVLLSIAPLVYVVAIVLSQIFNASDAVSTITEVVDGFVATEALPGFHRMMSNIRLDGKVAFIAIPGLLWVCTTAFHVFEVAVNLAFGVGQRVGRIWRARLIGLGTLITAGVIIGAATVATAFLPRLTEALRDLVGLPPTGGLVEHGAWWTAHFLTFLTFVVLYRVVPAVEVRWGAAFQGALVALVLWEVLNQLFGFMIGRSPAVGLVTGAFAGSMGFLLWIYFAVALSIYGAEVTAVVNGSRSASPENDKTRPAGSASREPS